MPHADASALTREGAFQLLDQYDTLRTWTKVPDLEEAARSLGLELKFVDEEARRRHELFKRLATTPFEVRSPFLEEHKLYPFQHAGMNLATEIERTLIQWDTGAGKTLLGSLVTQKLFDLGEIDLAIIVCKRAKLQDWEEYVQDATYLKVERIEGDRKKRHARYEETDAQVLVMNYEKLRYPGKHKSGKDRGKSDWSKTDLWQIVSLTDGKRVLFVFDEAQKIGNRDSLVSKGVRGLVNPSPSSRRAPSKVRMIALTATPYTTSPYNIRNIFLALKPQMALVSCNKDEFDAEYVSDMGMFGVRKWNERNLPKLGKRIESLSHVAMKSDPLIAAQFPKMVERPIRLEMSESDRRVYDAIVDVAHSQWGENNPMANLANFQLLRMICDTAESLRYSSSPLAQELVESRRYKLDTSTSAKYEAVESLCETIIEADDKIVLFTYWANAVIKPYLALLRKRFDGIPVFEYAGTTMKDGDREYAKREFNATKGGGILLMSDAGQEGLNLYAPYLAHIEMPYTYSGYKQRRDRIHRSDSIAKGIERVWIYRYWIDGTVEQRVNDKVFQRKHHAELIQGTPDVVLETDGGDETLTRDEMYKLMFGDRGR